MPRVADVCGKQVEELERGCTVSMGCIEGRLKMLREERDCPTSVAFIEKLIREARGDFAGRWRARIGEGKRKEDLANYAVLLHEIRLYTDALYEQECGSRRSVCVEMQGM